MEPMKHEDKLSGAMIEMISALSALNMYPKPIPAVDDRPRFLADSDEWVKHCQEHLFAACELLKAAEIEREELRKQIRQLRAAAPMEHTDEQIEAPNAPITDEDLAELKATKSDVEWNAICDRLKAARDGRYPPDWFVKVIMSGLMDRTQAGWAKTDENPPT